MNSEDMKWVTLMVFLFIRISFVMLAECDTTELDQGIVSSCDSYAEVLALKNISNNADRHETDSDDHSTLPMTDAMETSHSDTAIVIDDGSNQPDTSIVNGIESHEGSTDLDIEGKHDGLMDRDGNIYTEHMNKGDISNHSDKMDPIKVMKTFPGLFHTREEIEEMNILETRSNLNLNADIGSIRSDNFGSIPADNARSVRDDSDNDHDHDNCCPTKTKYELVEGERNNVDGVKTMIVSLKSLSQVIPVPQECRNGTCKECRQESVILWLLVHTDGANEEGQNMKFDKFKLPMYCSCKKLNCTNQDT